MSLAPHRAGVCLASHVNVVQLVHHILFNDTSHVSLAKHAPFDLPVVNEAFIASLATSILIVFASKVFWVVPVACIRHGAGALDGPSAIGGGAKRIVCLVIVVITKWFSVKDVKGLVGEGFLIQVK